MVDEIDLEMDRMGARLEDNEINWHLCTLAVPGKIFLSYGST